MLAIVGAGKMATAIAGGLIDKNIFKPNEMIATDISSKAIDQFQQRTGVRCTEDASEILKDADSVLLAVKPQVAEEVVRSIAALCGDKLIISIAAGIPLTSLSEWFRNQRVIRVMPNTPLMVGSGATVFACSGGVNEKDKNFVHQMFGALGIVYELDETLIDAVTAVSGSGPAYFFEMVAALTVAGVEVGLPEEVALALTVQTAAGAAEMLQAGLGSPDELRDAVTSPGGTTAAGLGILKDADFRNLIKTVVRAARDRSVELGRH